MDWENARVFLDCKFSDKCYGISVCFGCICRASECEFAPYMWNTGVLFTIIFFLLTNGWNEKSFAAIIITLLSIFSTLLITYVFIWGTNENGVLYEAMD